MPLKDNPYLGILPPSPPGETIAELVEEKGWTLHEFASRMGLTWSQAVELLRGDLAVSKDVAEGLERVVGSTTRFWLRREAMYRDVLKAIADRNADEKVSKIEKIE